MSDQHNPDAYYQQHVFVCTNERDDGRPCCADSGGREAQEYMKRRIKDLRLNGEGKIRINKSGCLDRCEEGPVMVVYPQGTWYSYKDNKDLDEIIDEHLVNGRVVKRLAI